MNDLDGLNKYKKLVQEQEAQIIRTEERIKNLEKEIKELSGEIRNKFDCEPSAKAIKAMLARLQEDIDADFEKLSGIFDNGDTD